MRRYIYFVFLLCCAVNLLLTSCVRQKYVVMDMVHHNPGEAMTESKFLDPSFLKKNRHKTQRKAKFYLNNWRSVFYMQGGLKQALA